MFDSLLQRYRLIQNPQYKNRIFVKLAHHFCKFGTFFGLFVKMAHPWHNILYTRGATLAATKKVKPPPLPTGVLSLRLVKSVIYLTVSTMALKASGLFMARSASTLRLISIPALVSLPMKTE